MNSSQLWEDQVPCQQYQVPGPHGRRGSVVVVGNVQTGTATTAARRGGTDKMEGKAW